MLSSDGLIFINFGLPWGLPQGTRGIVFCSFAEKKEVLKNELVVLEYIKL
jgi:hypothetical protein